MIIREFTIKRLQNRCTICKYADAAEVMRMRMQRADAAEGLRLEVGGGETWHSPPGTPVPIPSSREAFESSFSTGRSVKMGSINKRKFVRHVFSCAEFAEQLYDSNVK